MIEWLIEQGSPLFTHLGAYVAGLITVVLASGMLVYGIKNELNGNGLC
jgi:hypothetical protein